MIVCLEVSEDNKMSSLEMTGVMGTLGAPETDGQKTRHGLNVIITGSFNQHIAVKYLPSV